MTPEQQAKLFEEFAQGDPTRGQRCACTPLGCAFAPSLFFLIGGDVCVTSEMGKGLVFTVRLPGGAHTSTPMTFHADEADRARAEATMNVSRRSFLHLTAGAAAVPAVSRIARATQTYPVRPGASSLAFSQRATTIFTRV